MADPFDTSRRHPVIDHARSRNDRPFMALPTDSWPACHRGSVTDLSFGHRRDIRRLRQSMDLMSVARPPHVPATCHRRVREFNNPPASLDPSTAVKCLRVTSLTTTCAAAKRKSASLLAPLGDRSHDERQLSAKARTILSSAA
jgi:hypothetical protein